MREPESLCSLCARAVPQLCSWIDKGDRAGLEYISKFPRYSDGRESEVVAVTKCPRYKAGSLPPIGKLA